MSTVITTIDTTLWPRARNVATVAHASPARTKNCQACRPCSDCPDCRGSSVEVSKFIVETFIQFRIDRCRLSGPGMRVARPSDGDEAHTHHAGPAEKVRKQPREAVE